MLTLKNPETKTLAWSFCVKWSQAGRGGAHGSRGCVLCCFVCFVHFREEVSHQFYDVSVCVVGPRQPGFGISLTLARCRLKRLPWDLAGPRRGRRVLLPAPRCPPRGGVDSEELGGCEPRRRRGTPRVNAACSCGSLERTVTRDSLGSCVITSVVLVASPPLNLGTF